MPKLKIRPLLGLLLPMLASSCTLIGPDYQAPQEALPSQWQSATDNTGYDAEQLANWWQYFNDPVLDNLITEALRANTNLLSARSQLRQARALRQLASGERYPSVNASVSDQYSKVESKASSELYSAGFDASWELDLFGANTRALQAAVADLQAAEETLHDTRVGLIAEVARNYIELRTAERRLAIAENNLNALAETFQLTDWRYQAGMVAQLDVLQAQTLLEQSSADLPTLRSSIAASRYRLVVLLGRNPGDLGIKRSADQSIPTMNTMLAANIPAAVLQQRPDVRRAERQLAAQTARLGAAMAARYPSLRLSGSIGLQALSFGELGNGDVHRSLLASISAPIFDAGRIRANIEVQDALLEQSRLAYTAAVKTALEEVENALISLRNTELRQQQLDAATRSATAALALAKQQYSAGLADFQSVLDSQRTLLGLEDQLASGAGALSQAQIQLYKALGGGWTPSAEAAEDKAKEAG